MDNFREQDFVDFTYQVRKTGLALHGAYMPCLMYKDVALYAGLYPEGNIAGETKEQIVRFGDEFFYDRLQEMGVEHYTALDSIVYHLKEGELDEQYHGSIDAANIDAKQFEVEPYECLPFRRYANLRSALCRTFGYWTPPIPIEKKVSLLKRFFSKTKDGDRRIIRFLGIKISYTKRGKK